MNSAIEAIQTRLGRIDDRIWSVDELLVAALEDVDARRPGDVPLRQAADGLRLAGARCVALAAKLDAMSARRHRYGLTPKRKRTSSAKRR
jgi:hypothetical protein